LAVVSTHVPPASQEIREENLGIVTPVDAHAMAEAIVTLCADEKRLRTCRDNAIRKAQGHSWHAIYTRAVGESLRINP